MIHLRALKYFTQNEKQLSRDKEKVKIPHDI